MMFPGLSTDHIKQNHGEISWLKNINSFAKPLFFINKLARKDPGVRLNKKDSLTRYGNSHVKDKTS